MRIGASALFVQDMLESIEKIDELPCAGMDHRWNLKQDSLLQDAVFRRLESNW